MSRAREMLSASALLLVIATTLGCKNDSWGEKLVLPEDGLGVLFFDSMILRDYCYEEDGKPIAIFDVETRDGRNLTLGQWGEDTEPFFTYSERYPTGIFLRDFDSRVAGCSNTVAIELGSIGPREPIEDLSELCDVQLDLLGRRSNPYLFLADDLVCGASHTQVGLEADEILDEISRNPRLDGLSGLPCIPIEEWQLDAEALSYNICTGQP